ncbi:MAG: SpoIVB peptidase [Clostridia bacterium]|nr:SpoIVB peptidase [Clostridia bacterium]
MKTLKKISLLFVLIFLYVFVLSRNYIPETIAVEGQEIKISDIQVIPVGEIVGIKLYTSGVLVVGTSAIESIDGTMHKPFENTEIKEGDSIIAINENIVNNTSQLINAINMCNGEKITITYMRENQQKKSEIQPVKNKQQEYKIGLWVRDSAAGVGTVTFYNETTQSFAALGHAITDIDTGDIIKTSSGEIDDVNIISVVKGVTQEPGKIQGSIKSNSIIGNIYKNTEFGIYGIIKNESNLKIDYSKKMNVAARQEIVLGKAQILSNVTGEVKKYDIEIEKIYYNNNYDNKSMLIKVTDKDLLNETGGIIQGMSGSPIIQNEKFCGAITHVFINDPTTGYAVFADKMIRELSEN